MENGQIFSLILVQIEYVWLNSRTILFFQFDGLVEYA